MKVVRKLTPAQALGEANRRWREHLLQQAIAADLARLIAALPKPK